jgi:DNA ligase-1
MDPKFRPLLAAPIEDDTQLQLLGYPVIGSPKVDGIRVLIHPDHGPVTRSIKRVGNDHIWRLLNDELFHYLDGEVTVGANCGPGVFSRTTGAVRGQSGIPDFTYWVFDNFAQPTREYQLRLRDTEELVKNIKGRGFKYVELLESRQLNNQDDVLAYEKECLERGFEGIMVRHMRGIYKYNRSTFPQQILLKMKRFQDDEARIVGFEELYRNRNEQTRDNLGLADRSSHQSGMVAANTLGALKVYSPKFGDFSIGSGFDTTLRDQIWRDKDSLYGKAVTFKYQQIGTEEKPRFPIFKGFRAQE